MNIPKAIELNKQTAALMTYPDLQDKRDAILLGNEALKRVRDTRSLYFPQYERLLPGETKE